MDENRRINTYTKMKLLHFIVLYLIFKEINCTTTPTSPYRPRQKWNGNENEDKNYDEAMIKQENNTHRFRIDDRFCGFEESHHKFININKNIQTTGIVWLRTKVGEESITPFCSTENGLPLRRRCLLHKDRRPESEWDHLNNSTMLTDCSISMFCPAEKFQHAITNNLGYLEKHDNIWRRTQIGELSNLRDLCLQPNGLHLTRKCLYDAKNYRAIWEPVDHLKNFICLQKTRQPIISNDLNILYNNLTTSNSLLRNVTTRRHTAATLLSILEKPKINFLPGDVQITTEILKNIISNSQDVELSKYVFKIALNLMAVDPLVLRISAKVNATNCLLEMFENFMDTLTDNSVPNAFCNVSTQSLESNNSIVNANNITLPTEILNFSNIGVYAQIAKNASVFVVNPDCANISGIAVYDFHQIQDQQRQSRHAIHPIHFDSYIGFYFRFIFMNESINDLLNEDNLEVASFIPAKLWTNLKPLYHSPTRISQIVFKIYAHDSLFVEEGLVHLHKPLSKILSISIPGFKKQLPENLSFILRNKNPSYNVTLDSNTTCGYWSYNTWIRSGVATDLFSSETKYGLTVCSTDHLAQFAILKSVELNLTSIVNVPVIISYQRSFDKLSTIGCCASFIGLLCVYIKSMSFKDRQFNHADKFLLNMCIAIAFQIVLLLISNTYDVFVDVMVEHNYTNCVILGAFIQYSILATFIWLLITELLQYNYYVMVLRRQLPVNFVLKSAIISWGLPLIPTLLVVIFDWKSFIPNNEDLAFDTGICFPSGYGLYFGLLIPICLTVLLISIIIYTIFRNILSTDNNESGIELEEKENIKKEIYIFIISFSLISLSWVFGLFAVTEIGVLFSLMFCLTAPFQSFVILLYFLLWSPAPPLQQEVGIELNAPQ